MYLPNLLSSYQNPSVRDLAWVIGSVPLLDMPFVDGEHFSKTDCHGALMDMQAVLDELERDAGPLQSALDASVDRRLGAYFESLVKFWLDVSPRYDVLAYRLPIRSDNRTLGELDFVVFDREFSETQHWEVAVKFYLGVPGSDRWIGPGARDRLDIKSNHLAGWQIRQSLTTAGSEMLASLGIFVDSRRVFCKGRLFYPHSNPMAAPNEAHPEHLTGWWVGVAEISQLEHATSLWCVLEKSQWLAPGSRVSGTVSLKDISAQVRHRNRALCVARLDSQGAEVDRGFIVPDMWTDRASILNKD